MLNEERQQYSPTHFFPTGQEDRPAPTIYTPEGPVDLEFFPTNVEVGQLEFDPSLGMMVQVHGNFISQLHGYTELEGKLRISSLPGWAANYLETWSMEQAGFEWKIALTRSILMKKSPVEEAVVSVLKQGPNFHPPHLPAFARIRDIDYGYDTGNRYMGDFSKNLVPAKIVLVQTHQVVIEHPRDYDPHSQTVVGGEAIKLVIPEAFTSPRAYAMRQQVVHVVRNERYGLGTRWLYAGFISRDDLKNIDWSTAREIEHPEYFF